MLPFQLRHYRSEEHHQPIRQTPCGDTTFPSQTLHIDNEIFKKYHHLNTFLSTTYNEAIALEKKNKQQAGNPQWFKERKNQITASKFSKICKRMKDFTTKFVDSIFTDCKFTSEATTYGKKNENTAKQVYMEKNPNHHIHDCGLVINPNFSFLAATPDGKICIEREMGILEIKCPFSAGDMKLDEAAVSIPNFCLKQDGDSLSLKKSHEYYYQVQGQLMVTGVSFCVFVVYTRKDLYVEKLPVDTEFMRKMFLQLSQFNEDHHPACL